MGDKDLLFYTYLGSWDSNTLNYSKNFPYSLVFHPETGRFMNNGILYGSGDGGPYFVRGTNNVSNDNAGEWIGSHQNITEYYDGLSIVFVPNIPGSSSGVTLNISGLGAHNVYYNNSTPLTNQYSIGTPIFLTYVIESGVGYWKRADIDTTATPIAQATSGTDYFITLTSLVPNTNNNMADTLYNDYTKLRYNRLTETLYCTYFTGHLYGDISGNSETASKLDHSISFWGHITDLSDTNIKGDLNNVGDIKPETNLSYNIGVVNKKFDKVFANYFKGRADGVASYWTSNKKIYLLGQDAGWISSNATTAQSSTGAGSVCANDTLYLDTHYDLHASNIFIGTDGYNSQYRLFVDNGDAHFDNNVTIGATEWVKFNTTSKKVTINKFTTPTCTLDVVGNAYFTSEVTADSFIKINGTSSQLLVADGNTIEFSYTNIYSNVVQRDNRGNIYGSYFYSYIGTETLNSIGGIYVSNGTDNAIRKISIENLKEILDESDLPIIITKSLRVTRTWMNTGISFNSTNFEDGTYIVQIDATEIDNNTDLHPSIYSGVMSIYKVTNDATESEEIILHRSGYSTAKRLYLRTITTTTSNSGFLKLEIACSSDFSTSYDLKFKFKKII